MSPANTITEITAASADEHLVHKCLEGNEEAWSALIDKYRNLIFSIPIRYGLSSDDANEIFQEVCLTLLGELRRLREPRTLPAWLIQVTSRKCIRLRHKAARSATDSHLYNLDESVPADVDRLWCEELWREQLLREAVSELPSRCKHLIRMLFFTTPAVPYVQAAKILGLATGSIGFIRIRCLRRLRRRLEEKGFR